MEIQNVKAELVIPIYVDTNALLDVLASIEGGFSVVEKVTTRKTDTSGIDRGVKAEAGTEFGIPNVLSLLKLNLGYAAGWKKAKEEEQEKETERYHTYGSLFYRLREYLNANSLLKRLDDDPDWGKIQSSDFVEIRGVFRPNPFANSLEIVDRLLGMFQLVVSTPVPPISRDSKGTPSAQGEKKKAAEAKTQSKQMEAFRKFLQGVLSDIQSAKVRVFVIDLTQPRGYKVVTMLFLDYLRDQTMTEISHKEYSMLGKVVRKVEEHSDEPIDLLLGTGMGSIGADTLEQLVGMFQQMPGMSLPEIQTEIYGPALEIVPIAVFV